MKPKPSSENIFEEPFATENTTRAIKNKVYAAANIIIPLKILSAFLLPWLRKKIEDSCLLCRLFDVL